LLVGGVHGDEPSSTEALLDLLTALGPVRPSPPDPAAPRVWVVPALNPDGLVRSRKNNARDVDLNRNFPARNFTRVHPPGYDPGPAPLSEPESRVLADLIEREHIDGVVAVHAPFACVNFDGPAAIWASAVSMASGWPVRHDLGYPTPGSLGTWLGVDSRIPILTLELPPGTLTTFRAAAAAALVAAMDAAAWVPPG
jgi:protein MpaA